MSGHTPRLGTLELNSREVADPSDGSTVMVTPPLGGTFWLARVRVSQRQAVVCFPKFMTIGIGFQREQDWNTNLPYTCPAEEILAHMHHNKGRAAKDADCLVAIRILQGFAAGLHRRRIEDLEQANAGLAQELARAKQHVHDLELACMVHHDEVRFLRGELEKAETALREEAIQVAAMALAFAQEVCTSPAERTVVTKRFCPRCNSLLSEEHSPWPEQPREEER